ncbi:ATP-dependent DNA helicase [Ectothiorhodospiraceae bacterium 2226]|nr:ATP-dependent DNA helicase [Ectothiorhodospiraceae bacterium 2226]
MNAADIHDIFADDGPLAARLPGFAPRPQQQGLAEAVARTLADGGVLVAEAGTGTGKTFAYLVPALLSGRKVIVSTGTKNLQDQLFHRDLPLVREALAAGGQVALLKGRANYLCLHRLQQAADGGVRSIELAQTLRTVEQWAGRTRSGDVSELAEVSEDSPVWPLVTSTTDNCLGHECPVFNDCHLVKARRAAQEADLVVVNHHLLLADMALREEGFGEVLPAADAYIVDEAHQLHEVAASFFGVNLSSRQCLDLARDALVEQAAGAAEAAELRVQTQALEDAVPKLRLALGREARRAAWREAGDGPDREAALAEAVTGLEAALATLSTSLDAIAARSKGLDHCARRARALLERLRTVTAGHSEFVQWFETHKRGFSLNATPLDVGEAFAERMARWGASWVFTSATLAVGENFEHFCSRLGIADPETGLWASPFDYAHQAVFYVPEDMPDPAAPNYTRAVVEAALPVLEATQGRAFLLFTSHRALQEAARLLEGRLDYPLLVQGESPRGEMLARFRRLGNAVLLGTGSFWEGVDVRGEALSCVVIDKLPFASPGDPLWQARIEAERARGGNPFMDVQLPHAVILLKQGAGRLIRDPQDRGVLMVCDPRLLSRPYGRVFLESLPPMMRTRRLASVVRFMSAQKDKEAEA